ncbi:ATP-binding protein [Fusobacterium sp. PH5-44]|uniref:HAMP domain-containing sensor histidine kinase n=1 Tax=unclassified Fusobacterium TaxID=2648384 RepID=UPI003D22422E
MKIKSKLSIILLLSLFTIIFVDIFLGEVYFEKYFRYRKVKELKNINFINNGDLDYQLLKKYQEEKEAFVMVVENNQMKTLENFSYLVLSNNESGDKILLLDAILDNLYSNENFDIETDDEIQVDAIKIIGNYYAPVKIDVAGKIYKDYKYINRNFAQESITGTIKKIKNSYGAYSESDDFIEFLIETGLENIETGNYIDDDDEYMVISRKIENKNVIVFYAYENIKDIFPTIKSYFYIKGLFVIILIIVIGKILGRKIVNPIEDISNIATNIGKLNFQKKTYQKTNDEIEKLYEEIYQMSDNLENVINLYKIELRENKKNKGLMEEKIKYFMHEIKTPLSAIIGFSDLIYESNKDENIQIINNEGKRLLKLTSELTKENITDITDIMNLKTFKLYPMIEMALKIYEKELKNLHVNIQCNRKIEVFADREKIEQVMFNLLNNSIHHSEKYISIIVDEFADNIVISLENDGEKITEENIYKVWNKYFTTKEDGAGIGLYVCKKIFELHNSVYSIENTELGVKVMFSLKKF